MKLHIADLSKSQSVEALQPSREKEEEERERETMDGKAEATLGTIPVAVTERCTGNATSEETTSSVHCISR